MKRISSFTLLTVTSLAFTWMPGGVAWADHHGEETLSQKIDSVLAGIGQPNEAERYEPRMALEAMTAAASKPGSDLREAYVGLLLEKLGAEETAQASRAWIIRQLENVGGAESVPALRELMGSPFHHLRDLARRALQQNPSAEAGAALRALAAEEQDPGLKAAIVHSLGERRDAEAVSLVASLAEREEGGLRSESVRALGKIASEASVKALFEAYQASEGKGRELAAALLESASRLAEGGEADRAKEILQRLAASEQPSEVRASALREWVKLSPGEADERLLLAMQAEDPEVRAAAITSIRMLEKPNVMAHVLAVKLPDLSGEEWSLALPVLRETGDLTVASQLAGLVGEGGLPVERETEIIGVLGGLGGVDAAQRLVDLAGRTAEDSVRDAVRAALGAMPGEGVDAALMTATQEGDLSCRGEAVRALAERGTDEARPLLYAHVEKGPKRMRQVSLQALGQLAGAEDLPRLAGYVGDSDEEALRAVMQACRRAQGSAEAVEAVSRLIDAQEMAGKEQLLPCLGLLGGADALAKVRELAGEEALRKQAMRTLSNWPGAEAAPVLLEAASAEGAEASDRTLALRGLARLVSDREAEVEGDERLRLALQGLDAAERLEDKRLFLPVLGFLASRDPQALEALVGLLQQGEVREEAALALVNAVETMRGRRTDRTKQQILKEVIRAEVEADTVERAQKLLDQL